MFSLNSCEALTAFVRHACQKRLFVLKSVVTTTLYLSIIGFAIAQPPHLSSTPLTLMAALNAAEIHSKNLLGQDALIRAFHEKAILAGTLPDPVLGLSINNLPVDGAKSYSLTDDFMTMSSVSLMQTFSAWDKRQIHSSQFLREADAATAMRSLEVSSLRTQTAQAWFELYYQQKTLALLLLQRTAATLVVEAAQSRYRVAQGEQSDVFAASAAVARIDDQLHVVRADLSNAESLLARWVGDPSSVELGQAPKIDHTRLDTDDLNHLIEHHPDITLMSAKEQVALAEAQVAREDKNADWNWSLMYSKRGRQFGDMVSLGVSIPLLSDQKDRQDRELSFKLEKVEKVHADKEEMLRERLFNVKRLLSNWRSSLSRLVDYDKTLIPLTAQRSQACESAFKGGKGSLVEVLEARRMEVDTRIERLRIEKQTAFLWATLEFLIPDTSSQDATGLVPLDLSSPEQSQ